jgi:hypothetical protein
MLRFKELNELFNKPLPFKLDKTPSGYAADVDVNGKNLFLKFQDIGGGTWEFFFKVDLSWHKTGGGNEIVIFATVIEFLKQASKKVKPKHIIFSADKGEGASRTKLYQRMVKKHAKEFGYTSDVKAKSSAWGKEDHFTLTKK